MMMHFQILNSLGVYVTTETYETPRELAYMKGFDEWKNKRIEIAREFKFKWRVISAKRLAEVGNDPMKTRISNVRSDAYRDGFVRNRSVMKPTVQHPHRLRARTRRCYLEGRATYPVAE